MSQYYYLVQAFEADVVKIWGKESNLKRRGGGESKFIEEYTPLNKDDTNNNALSNSSNMTAVT